MSDQAILTNGKDLHDIRERRNDLAHEIGDRTTWAELATDVDVIEATLRQHRFVQVRPKLEFYAERSAMRDSDDPTVICVQDFKVGVTENGKPAIEFKWSEALHRDGE